MGPPAGYTDITVDGGPLRHRLQSVSLNVSLTVCRVQALETVAHHNKLHCVGDGSLTWQGCYQPKIQVGSEYTITHKVESVEQKSDGTQALAGSRSCSRGS